MIGHDVVGDAGVGERVPGVLDLGEAGHVGHRAAGRQVGQDHLLVGAVRMSADSAMKCTPQKTMYSASGRAAASRASLKESPVTSANCDDLVALVVVAEHEDPLAERLLGRAGPLDQVGVGGGRQVARALDATLGGAVGAEPQRQQGKVDCRHVESLSRGLEACSQRASCAGGTASAGSSRAGPGSHGSTPTTGPPGRCRRPTRWPA